MQESDAQSHIFREFLKANLRLKTKISKPQQDRIQQFVMKYFGREMKGETDRSEFRKIVKEISDEMGVQD